MPNSNYHPKNRKDKKLDILDIEVESSEGIKLFDPNSIAMMAATGEYQNITPIPNLKSEISKKPAYKIRTDDIELHLSFEEMDRFFRRSLRKREVAYLIETYGMFYEIHGDFYVDGVAWQPIEIPSETKQKILNYKKFALAEKMKNKLEKELNNKTKKDNFTKV